MRAIIGLGLVLILVFPVSCGGNSGPGTTQNPSSGDWIFENPMADTKVGEWAIYRLGEDEKSNTLHLEVIENRAAHGDVLVQQENRGADVERFMDRTVKPFHRNHFLNGFESAGWIVMRMYPDEIFVAGKRIKCMCIEYLTRLSGNVKVWYSQEIPVWGMLRQVRVAPDMKETVNAEILDWSGRTEK